jgi:hypothetical protein
MRMFFLDQVLFPDFKKYVRDSLPKVADVKSIIQAFQKFGQIDRTTLQRALKWGENPEILVVHELKDKDGNRVLGLFRPGEPNVIRVDLDLVKEFEAGRGISHTKSGKPVYLVGVTLLHELIHWADNLDGTDFPGEEGEQFERAVYGHVVV